ncbi:MAG: hypothetical protein MK160_13670, partial [Rhodobacteraceae bacterium]|nr:hypothetical protein [Paracoccaceae bacterium]
EVYQEYQNLREMNPKPSEQSVKRLIEVVGDLPIDQYTRSQAQEINCDGRVASDRDVSKQFWDATTVDTVSGCLKAGIFPTQGATLGQMFVDQGPHLVTITVCRGCSPGFKHINDPLILPA